MSSGSQFDLKIDPFVHFERELKKAETLNIKDFNAMSLATCGLNSGPSLRTVLFKGVVREGFSFYTNYGSQKSQEMLANPKASLLFFWTQLEQQIRIEGIVQKLTREESEKYFASRPRLSQIGAWASTQSEIIPNAEYLADKVRALEAKYHDQLIPCPPFWGGWHLLPLNIEFWFGRQGRLHDRYVYSRDSVSEKNWQTVMKSP